MGNSSSSLVFFQYELDIVALAQLLLHFVRIFFHPFWNFSFNNRLKTFSRFRIEINFASIRILCATVAFKSLLRFYCKFYVYRNRIFLSLFRVAKFFRLLFFHIPADEDIRMIIINVLFVVVFLILNENKSTKNSSNMIMTYKTGALTPTALRSILIKRTIRTEQLNNINKNVEQFIVTNQCQYPIWGFCQKPTSLRFVENFHHQNRIIHTTGSLTYLHKSTNALRNEKKKKQDWLS